MVSKYLHKSLHQAVYFLNGLCISYSTDLLANPSLRPGVDLKNLISMIDCKGTN